VSEEQQRSTVDYEEVWGDEWNDATEFGPTPRHRRRILAGLTRSLPYDRLLDLGCGDGRLLEMIGAGREARHYGSDVSSQALELAAKRVPDAAFFQLDITEQELPATYDVVVLSEVLEHLEDDEGVLRRVAGHTRHVVISVPGGPADKVEKQYGHLRNYAGDLLKTKLEAGGFDVVVFRRWGAPFYELVQFATALVADPVRVSVGKYSASKRLVSSMLYWLFFLNVFPAGSQVFAVGKSKRT